MIVDSLKNYKLYSGIHQDWEKAFLAVLHYLSEPIPKSDRISVNRDGIEMLILKYKTKAFAERKYEIHKKNIDIQFLVKGKETIYFAKSEGLETVEPYSEAEDKVYLADSPCPSPLNLVTDDFAVFMPGEAHKTQCVWDDSLDTLKIIVKLPVK